MTIKRHGYYSMPFFNERKVKMIAIYVRQSIDKKDSISIDTQVEHCKKELQEGEEYKVYSDKGYSGSNIYRPAFQEMLNDINKGIVECIIVYRLDRISRSVLDFANLINIFNKYGTNFISTQERFDTKTPMGKAMLNLAMVFAQLERDTIQSRITDNYYSRAEKGMYPGGPAPYGFELINEVIDGRKLKQLKPDVCKADIVEKMYKWYTVEKLSLGAIARQLNDKEVKGNKGASWSSNRVCMILRNPIYVRADLSVYKYYKERGCTVTNHLDEFIGENGCYLYGKRKASTRKYSTYNEHKLSLAPSEGIIDADVFIMCQRMLDKNKQIENKLWGTKTWLTGIVKCEECGRSVVAKDATWIKDGQKIKRSYLKCSGAVESNGCSCKNHFGNVEEIEEAVFQRIKEVILKYKDIRVEVSKRITKEQNDLQIRIADCEEKISKIIDLAVNGDDTSMLYLNAKISEIDRIKRGYEAELNKLNSNTVDKMMDSIEVMLEQWNEINNKQRNELASFFIERIDIAKDKMTIHWKENFVANDKD